MNTTKYSLLIGHPPPHLFILEDIIILDGRKWCVQEMSATCDVSESMIKQAPTLA